MFKRVAIGCGVALAVVFCISVIVVVVLIATEGSSVVLEVDEGVSSSHEGSAESVGGTSGLTLGEARKRAAETLEADPSLCQHILGESLAIAFGTGISIEHDGKWYLRGRCSDDAYLVVVSPNEVEYKTCAAARASGQSCQNSDWLSD